MNCPRCGNKIEKNDVVCSVCRMPVSMMNDDANNQNSYENVDNPYVDPKVTKEQPWQEIMPTYNEPVNSSENSNKYQNYGEGEKAITSLKFIIPIFIGVISLIIVASGIYMAVKVYIQDKTEEPTENVVSSYKVEFNNFTYTLSGEYTYSKDLTTNTLHVKDSDNTWNSAMQTINSSYTNINKESLKLYFVSIGYTAKEINEQLYKNSSFLTLELVKDNKNYLFVVTKAGNTSYTLGVLIEKEDNQFAYDLLDEIYEIANNLKYNNSSSSDMVDFNLDGALK